MAALLQGAKLVKDLKERINGATKRDACFFDITEQSGLLGELNTEVHPQLAVIDFYKGGYLAPEHDYYPQSVEARRRHEYHKGHKKDIKITELSEILRSFENGQITFVGPAGSGKTTLLKAIARHVIDGEYEVLKDIEYVHFLQGRNLNRDSELTTADLLLHNVEPMLSKEEAENYFRFVKANPSKVLFVVDSLDTLPYALEEENRRMTIFEKAYPRKILWNLLTNKLFPGCKVITSSREHTIRKYKADLRADKVIALVGLTRESIHQIIVGYLGEKEATEVIRYMETESPALMNLSSTPVFLSFNLIGLKSKSEFKPSTMSGVLVLVLQSLAHSDHTRVESIREVIDKLKGLAFDGTKEKRVLFSTSELEKYSLELKDVTDLTILAPVAGKKCYQKLLQYENSLFFSHQSLQEVLAASCITQMDLEQFEEFIEDNIHTPHYTVIRRFLCGIMLDERLRKASEGIFGETQLQHRQVLKRSMQDQLERAFDDELLEILIALHEAGDGMDDITLSIHEMPLRRIPLTPSDIQAVGSVLAHCTRLMSLGLMECNLDANLLSILRSSIEKSVNLNIKELDVSENENMGVDGVRSIGEIVKRCKVQKLNMAWCDLSSEQVLAFNQFTEECTIEELYVFGNRNMGVDGVRSIGEIVKRCKVQKLNMADCDLSSEQVLAFNQSTEECTIEELDVTGNRNIGVDGVRSIGEIVKRCKVQKLNMARCDLSTEHVLAFNQSTEECTIEELDVSFNKNMGVDGVRSIGEIVKRCKVKKLNMAACNLSSEQVLAFNQSTEGCTIEELNVSGNKNMGVGGVRSIGEIVKRCKVQKLSLRACDMSIKQVLAFNQSTEECTMKELDLLGNRFGSEEVAAVCELLPKITDRLGLRACEIDKENKDRLQLKLDELCPTRLLIEMGSYFTSEELRARLPKEPAGTTGHLNQPIQVAAAVTQITGHPDTSRQEHLPISKDAGGDDDDKAGGFSQSLDCEIGTEGDSVEIGGCIILFPKGAFAAANRVHFAVSTGGKDESDKLIAVSPKLHCSSELPLLAPVRVKIPIWVSINDPTIRVRILRKEDTDGAEWDEIKSIPAYTIRGTFVEFDCGRFSLVGAFINFIKGIFGFLTYFMSTTLYHNRFGDFTATFHLDDVVVRDKAKQDVERLKYQPTPHIFGPQSISLKDKIEFSLKSESEEYKFANYEHGFTVSKDFIQGRCHEAFPSMLEPKPAHNTLAVVNCVLEIHGEGKSGEKVRKSKKSVPCRMPLLTEPEDTEQQPSTSTKTDQSTAAGIIVHGDRANIQFYGSVLNVGSHSNVGGTVEGPREGVTGLSNRSALQTTSRKPKGGEISGDAPSTSKERGNGSLDTAEDSDG